MNTEIAKCINCGKEFVIHTNYYRNRGFVLPKKCPACRGRIENKVLFEGNVRVDIDPNTFFEKKDLIHRDKKGQQFFAGVRYKLKAEKVIPIYDLTKVRRKLYYCRIMERQNGNVYVVLDYPTNEKPVFVLKTGDEKNNVVFSRGSLIVTL